MLRLWQKHLKVPDSDSEVEPTTTHRGSQTVIDAAKPVKKTLKPCLQASTSSLCRRSDYTRCNLPVTHAIDLRSTGSFATAKTYKK